MLPAWILIGTSDNYLQHMQLHSRQQWHAQLLESTRRESSGLGRPEEMLGRKKQETPSACD